MKKKLYDKHLNNLNKYKYLKLKKKTLLTKYEDCFW